MAWCTIFTLFQFPPRAYSAAVENCLSGPVVSWRRFYVNFRLGSEEPQDSPVRFLAYLRLYMWQHSLPFLEPLSVSVFGRLAWKLEIYINSERHTTQGHAATVERYLEAPPTNPSECVTVSCSSMTFLICLLYANFTLEVVPEKKEKKLQRSDFAFFRRGRKRQSSDSEDSQPGK